jgi:hypothetical protein
LKSGPHYTWSHRKHELYSFLMDTFILILSTALQKYYPHLYRQGWKTTRTCPPKQQKLSSWNLYTVHAT